MSAEAAVDGSDEADDCVEDRYEHAPCGLLPTTPGGVVVKVNRTYLTLTGYTSDQVVGQPSEPCWLRAAYCCGRPVVCQYQVVQLVVQPDAAGSTQDQRPLAVIFLDLDGFKAINDQLGHNIGNAVRVQTAQRLRTAARHGDTIARFGGDEFVVVCADSDIDTAVNIADRIRDAVRQPLPNIPPALPLTVSVGVPVHHPNGHGIPDPDIIIRNADTAMYRSKRDGKDRHTVVQT